MSRFFGEARPDTDSQSKSSRDYNITFALLAAEKLVRLLRWKVRKRPRVGTIIKIHGVSTTLGDVLMAKTPEDLIRRQKGVKPSQDGGEK